MQSLQPWQQQETFPSYHQQLQHLLHRPPCSHAIFLLLCLLLSHILLVSRLLLHRGQKLLTFCYFYFFPLRIWL